MSYTWVPFYKELAQKLLQFRNDRTELVRLVYGLEDDFVDFLREKNTKKEFTDLHPFAVFAIFGRLFISEKKNKIFSYLKEKLQINAEIPVDFDGIPSINPQKSFWGLNWYEDDSELIEQNWQLFESALSTDFNPDVFSDCFNKVLKQNGAKWNITHALFRIYPERFMSLDKTCKSYLESKSIQFLSDNELNGKNYLTYMDKIKSILNTKELSESSFLELSYNAWLNNSKSINYWLIAPGEEASLWEICKEKGFITIGWGETGDISSFKSKEKFQEKFKSIFNKTDNHGANDVWKFYNDIKEGDIIFAKGGVSQILGMGIVTSDYYFDNSIFDDDDYFNFYDVNWIYTKPIEYPHGIQKTLTLYSNKTDDIRRIIDMLKENQNKVLNSTKQLVLNTHNLILHGAPGTGKTYLAKQIAKEMGCSDGEIGFVQFHPSYDYTDFVEGLRPVHKNEEDVSFEKTDGIFKKFCIKALETYKETNGTDNFNECYDKLIEKIEKENFVLVDTISKTTKFRVEQNEYENGLTTRTYPNDEYKKGEWIPGHSRFYTKEQLYNIYRGLPGVPKGGHDNYRKAIVQYMKDYLSLKDYKPGIKREENQKFVFIIDEINRGELSKIFGELFYSIDPGYRVDVPKLDKQNSPVTIKTQYSNMQDGPNEFDVLLNEQEEFGHFFIPENVYIIGTMNDIDRSVESMDFAFRRRFTFKEITAKDTQEAILSELEDSIREEAVKRMDSLNNAIDGIDGLSSAYHIGGAYFLKLKDLENSFENLWEYHLSGLLREYLIIPRE